ncbi:MAG: ATP-dependent Clp protease adaptor ClpS [Bacteroidales bacterium]|nr:ATP-dependent Clp protease adaptor ClpS [Bacteroidales bacterium]
MNDMKPEEFEVGKPEFDELTDRDRSNDCQLVLHNDDVHTFDYVIESLIDVCKMDVTQAEQCTYLVHYKGKCDVRRGSFSDLKPYKEGLIERELNATIDR